MRKLRNTLGILMSIVLALGVLACLVAALCDQKGSRIGQMFLQSPR